LGGAAPHGERKRKRRRGGWLTEEAIRASGEGDGVLSLDKVAERSVRVGENSRSSQGTGVDLGGSAGPKTKANER
jgi:hypothetical protein